MNTKKVILPNAVMLKEVSNLLDEGRSVTIMTKGGSMSPFIRGERDSVELAKKDRVEVGDIVLAHLGGGRYVLHRVHTLDGENVVLKGDGNLDATESCTVPDVCGTVVRILRGDKTRYNCESRCFRRASRCWVAAPRIIRRYSLGIYRRIKIL